MRLSRTVVLMSLIAVVAAALAVAIPRPETPEERVARLASEFRCVVCQGLSVNDSPSGAAREMRDLVARRVAEGRTDEEIRAEFRRSYGDWVFLSPPLGDARGLVWLVPLAAMVAGALFAVSRIRASGTLADPRPEQLALLRERAGAEEAEL